MIMIIVPSMNKCLFRKKLVNACSVPVDDVPNCVSEIFLFMKEMEWLKKA